MHNWWSVKKENLTAQAANSIKAKKFSDSKERL